MASLNQCCEHLRQQVAAARRENAPILDEASLLFRQKQELETKRQLLDAFNKHFIVSEEDTAVLTGAAGSIDERFFAILKRVKNIHRDCQTLLGGENQRLGVELMEQCARHLNLGYQKLYRWIQKELKNLNLENPQINSIIRGALRALSERPALFQGCLDFFAEARERVLTDAFYAALTGSSTGTEQDQLLKPIEFHAHDPLRYVGDMLAWTHSATVSEREALENLFVSEGEEFKRGFEKGREAEPWSIEDSEGFDGQKALSELVNRNVAGIARALRQRIEQVLTNHENPVLLYKISNLIHFYRSTFSKLLGAQSSLLETLEALGESSLKHFHIISNDNVNSIDNELPSPQPDLGVPDFFEEALIQFADLLKTYDASLTPPESRAADFQSVTQAAFDPYILACEKMSRELEEPQNKIFLSNCLLAARTTLSRRDFVQTRLETLATQLDQCTANLTEYQHAFFLHTSGLHPLLAALAPIQDTETSLLSAGDTSPALKPESLSDASQTLDEFLPSALMDAMENLKRLNDKAVAQEVTAEAAERFCEDFEYVDGKLLGIDEARVLQKRQEKKKEDEGEANGDEDEDEDEELLDGLVFLKSLFPRTSGEIRVLLS